MILIYTDGACEPNPGMGGWAFYDKTNDFVKWGHEEHSTNNIMELSAIIYALEYLEGRPGTIYSDSQYCVNGINEWMHNWKKKGWTRSGGLKNKELWQRIYNMNRAGVRFKWIRGHNGIRGNEIADQYANNAAFHQFTGERWNLNLSRQLV
jgi:ribonuclease HI